jgi:hypothetical protein
LGETLPPDSAPVTCVILSRGRLDFLVEATRSAGRQTRSFERIIISDCTPGLDGTTKSQFREKLSEASGGVPVDVIFRDPSNEFADNWTQNLEVVDTPWVVFFHDDDVFEPEYLDIVSTLQKGHPDCLVFGVGASIIGEDGRISGSFCRTHIDRVVNGPVDLVEHYYCVVLTRPAPFPGYCYSTDLLKQVEMPRVGRLSDVAFLLSLLKKTKLVWSCREVIRYRMHESQDTQSIGEKDFVALFQWIQGERFMEQRQARFLGRLATLRSGTRSRSFLAVLRFALSLCWYRMLK